MKTYGFRLTDDDADYLERLRLALATTNRRRTSIRDLVMEALMSLEKTLAPLDSAEEEEAREDYAPRAHKRKHVEEENEDDYEQPMSDEENTAELNRMADENAAASAAAAKRKKK